MLIIEDNMALRLSLSSWLNDLYPSMEIHYAADGEEGLEIANYIRPDIALIDIGLPGMSGFEVTQKIKKQNLNTSIIILTIHEGPEYESESVSAGANCFINKKEMLKRLPETINSLIYNNWIK